MIQAQVARAVKRKFAPRSAEIIPYGRANATSASPGLLGISPWPPAATMTYRLREDGRQYVVVAAGGHGLIPSKPGDALVAFALP